MDENSHFFLLPHLKNEKCASRPHRLLVGFAALAGLVALLANARGRTRVTPSAHLGLGRRAANPSLFFLIVRFPGTRSECAWALFGAGSWERGAHAGPSLAPEWSPLLWEVGRERPGTRAARWAPVLRTEACLQVPGGAGPLVRRPGDWAQKGRSRHLSANVAQPV